ncbi:MAG: CHAT domain-containing protein [Flavobacteriaceae bacterium]|nr:CHAT domain-containing protein [Flavobacteriaceae bacterium]
MKYSLPILFFLFCNLSVSQIKQIEYEFDQGNYSNVIKISNELMNNSNSLEEKLILNKYINQAHINLSQPEEFLTGIKRTRNLDTNKIRRDIYYYNELSNYYQNQLRIDSAIFFSNKSMKILSENFKKIDSNLKCDVYSRFGSSHRNRGVKSFNKITPLSMEWDERNTILNKYLDTASQYTKSNYIKSDIYLKKGLVYLDALANNYSSDGGNVNAVGHKSFLLSNKNFQEVADNSKNNFQISKAYLFIGLNHFYLKKYNEADAYYQKATEKILLNGTITHYPIYINILNWRGWNYDIWFNETKDLKLLDLSIKYYKQNVKQWALLNPRDKNNKLGKNDGYRENATSKLTASLGKKYLLTNNSIFLKESFQYSDYSKYPNFPEREFSIEKIQLQLKENEAFIQNITTGHPYQEIIFLILKGEAHFILNDKSITNFSYYRVNELHQFNDLKTFKKWSYILYNSKFKKVDSILKTKDITDVIISNSDYNPTINYDIIISDTLSKTWKTQPYLFHKYNFSYSLCVRSFLESRENHKSVKPVLGLTIGDFENDVDLRFSKKLITEFSKKYKSEKLDITTNLKNSNIALILSHGNSKYENEIGEIRTSAATTFSVDDVFNMNLENDFIIVTSCSSNASQTNYSEGSSGNFSKAFRYSGVKSTLTTSWDIDDKANSFIMSQFFKYLSKGEAKNRALWKAKKDYWNQSVDEEEFKPLYWAPYILTGNVDSVEITKNSKINWNWSWLLLILPIGYFIYYKRR